MNIFKYINSKDIRKHLEKINYKFTSLEAAWLIYQCKGITLKEKQTAFNELIDTMPDCEIEKRNNTVLHTQNPVGRENMQREINQYWPKF